MLVYHPAFDAYHCVFRVVTIIEGQEPMEIDRLRILDFVLCFPSVVTTFRLPQNVLAIRKSASLAHNAYRNPINPKATFGALSASQDGALACLAAADIVVPGSLRDGVALRTSTPLPNGLMQHCATLRMREVLFFERILPSLLDIPLLGHDGLKARSGLLEYRYDSVQA